jgi:hypothetical protein
MRLRTVSLMIAAVAGLAVASAHAAARRRAEVPVGPPAAYQDLYAQLTMQLAAAEGQVAPLHPELSAQPLYAADLLPANGNRGEDLLQPGTMDGVRAFLDRFQQLGIHGVVFPIGYPLLIDRFPRSAEYLQFYQEVMAEVRKRGMTVDIESSVVFANSPFSSIQWDYSKTAFADFVRERHDMTARIVSQLAPDYLNLGSEPDTEAKLTGYGQLDNPASWAQYLDQIIQGIDRGKTRIGAGLGTWNSAAFVDAEGALGIDFIALHIYPVDSASISTALRACSIARTRQKRIIVDESWLFKARAGESSSIAADANVFLRDAFSFFAPLDQQFLHFMDDFARVEGVEFLSAFWSTYFFAYIPYGPSTQSLAYSSIVQQVNSAASQNIVKGQYSSTGYYYGSLIAGRR